MVPLLEDSQIKADIENSLEFDPGITSHNIIVKVENGIVTLLGTVEFYYEKPLAEKIAKSVYGVKGIINELYINLEESLVRSDEEIAKAAVRALEWDSSIPPNKVKVIVEHGVLKLSRELEWQYQRDRAYNAVKYLFGIKNIINDIKLIFPVSIQPKEVENKILSEFQRNATIDARAIHVETEGGKIILKGYVRTWPEYEEARRAAWSIPGVIDVDSSQLHIQ